MGSFCGASGASSRHGRALDRRRCSFGFGGEMMNGVRTARGAEVRRWRGPGSGPWPVLQGVLPVRRERVPAEVLAGLTLAALGVPEVLGYAKIAGMPLVTGLYTMLLPMAVFAVLGSSRHLVVAADSATAAILAAALTGLAAAGFGPVRAAGRAGGAADRGDAAGRPAGPARLPGQLPVPHRAGRVPDRGRPPGRGRAAARHARGDRGRAADRAPAGEHAARAARTRTRPTWRWRPGSS